MPAIKPLLKPYSEIVKTAARLFSISELDAEIEIDARLRKLKVPKITVVLYVNWASHNALTYKKLAEITGISVAEIKVRLWQLKRRWKHLFKFGVRPSPVGNRDWGRKTIDMDWIDAETRRLGIRGTRWPKGLAGKDYLEGYNE